jgi:hypothetical protein
MRQDGLIEFEGHLINPVGMVVWPLDKVNELGPQEIAKRSLDILKRWREHSG